MSVRVMAQVWEHSQHAGTERLMLLAIADFADDDGRAYPAVATLAMKCRMTTRNANLVLAELRASGELQVRPNEGPKGTNLYRVVPTARLKKSSGLKNSSGGLKRASPTPEAGFLEPLKPASDEPSLNHQEPSIAPAVLVETAAAVFDQHHGRADADGTEQPGPTGQQMSQAGSGWAREGDDHGSSPFVPAEGTYRTPPCPYGDIAQLYVTILPALPAIAILSDVRKRHMSARWREVCTSEKYDSPAGVEFFRWFFERVSKSDFLMGRTKPRLGQRLFKANFDWLMTPTYFVKVCETGYSDQPGVAA